MTITNTTVLGRVLQFGIIVVEMAAIIVLIGIAVILVML